MRMPLITLMSKKRCHSCLLYTSPSPRDGLLSIRRQASDVYKRQDEHHAAPVLLAHAGHIGARHADAAHHVDVEEALPFLSLIHISEPTRRTPLYSSASVRCV